MFVSLLKFFEELKVKLMCWGVLALFLGLNCKRGGFMFVSDLLLLKCKWLSLNILGLVVDFFINFLGLGMIILKFYFVFLFL